MHQNQVQRGARTPVASISAFIGVTALPLAGLHHLTRTFGVGWEARGMGPSYLSRETIRYRICNSPSTTKE